MELLLGTEDRGYPTEYLVSRIRGRRSRLVSDWGRLVYESNVFEYLGSRKNGRVFRDRSAEGIWRELMREYRWVYLQMNAGLRRIFEPYFLYTELRTLFICLRQVNAGKAGAGEELLEISLLNNELKGVLNGRAGVEAVVAGLERILVQRSRLFAGLPRVFGEQGLRGVEQHLVDACLSMVLHERLHALLRQFFAMLIDSRNLMAVFKYLRQGLTKTPALIKGGALSMDRLIDILTRQDLAGAAALVREHAGIRAESPDLTQAEIGLYRSISRTLRKGGSAGTGVGLILDYLWRCSIEAMNLGVLAHGRDLERELVSAELVV